MRRFIECLSLLVLPAAARSQGAIPPGYEAVASRLGAAATPTGGYVRFNLPRRDLTVMVGDVRIAPALALTGWLGFDGPANDAMLMGDLVVTSAEIGAVERVLIEGGLTITAVHNHLAGETPDVKYVHVHGHGDAMTLARTLDQALARTGLPRPVAPSGEQPLTADTALFFDALGVRGRGAGSVANLSLMLVPGAVTLGGMPLRASLALASPVNMQWVSRTRAVTTGDFTVGEPQLDALVRALVTGGLTVTALHSHLTTESPRVMYVHFWGDGDPASLAATLRKAADAARSAR